MLIYPQDFGQRYNIRFVLKPVLSSLVKRAISSIKLSKLVIYMGR